MSIAKHARASDIMNKVKRFGSDEGVPGGMGVFNV